MKQQMKIPQYWFKTSLTYGLLAAGFSLIGLLLPYGISPKDPLESASVEHVVGHIVFGMMAAFASLSFRYIMLGGMFAIILDSDHLVNFLNLEMISRMGHSIPFAILAPIVLMLIFGKKDYLLGAIAFAAVFSHISFDTLLGTGTFPILIPFSSHITDFQASDWIIFQLIAFGVVLGTKIIIGKKDSMKSSFQNKTT